MQNKLTITINEEVYESLVRPHVIDKEIEVAYQRMSQDESREAEALEWIEGTLGEITDETR
jgi:predicted CopG family antitoxin